MTPARLFPPLTFLVMIGPVLAGLWGTILPAFGHLPAAGFVGPTLAPFHMLAAWPGLWPSVWLTLTTGVLATVLAVTITFLILSAGSGGYAGIRRFLSPLLSVPHAAAAFGLAFLIAPSGMIVRALSPWATGWDKPPDIAILQDPDGFAMVAGLVAKEVPFLFLMGLAALGQAREGQSMTIVRALGYGQTVGWFKAVFPAVYRQMRLPIFAVLAYSLSVVDLAIILGPNTPPPLSVQILRWMGDPALEHRLIAGAASLVQLGLVVGAIGIWLAVEKIMFAAHDRWIFLGARWPVGVVLSIVGLVFGKGIVLILFSGLGVLAFWSFAGFWGFRDVLPDSLTTRTWMQQGPGMVRSFGTTATIAGVAVGIAVILTIGCLQAETQRKKRPGSRALWLLYVPLLVPQTAFLPGLQTFLIGTGFASGAAPVILAHLVFVLPYVFLSLSDPFRAWDPRLQVIGAALGKAPGSVLFSLRLPMLLRPILTAAAVGFAVSVGQYLPTLLIGGGRVSSLTTEAVALSSGGDRRAIGVWALGQTGAALVPFVIATLLPLWVWRHRKGVG